MITLLNTFARGLAPITTGITGVAGTISHGNSLIISGSGFGTKTIPAPTIYDDMESGLFSASWTDTQDLTIQTGTQRHALSTYNAGADLQLYDYIHFQASSDPLDHNGKHFGSFFFYLPANFAFAVGGALYKCKLFRLWPAACVTPPCANVYAEWQVQAGGNYIQYVVEQTSEMRLDYTYDITTLAIPGEWNQVEVEYQEASAPGNLDGVFRLWFNGGLLKEIVDFDTANVTDELYKSLGILGLFNSSYTKYTESCVILLDEPYYDQDWARVVIGNASTWATCTIKEYQLPSAWSDSSITITCKQNSFNSGNTGYLYIVLSDGTLFNSSGYPLIFA